MHLTDKQRRAIDEAGQHVAELDELVGEIVLDTDVSQLSQTEQNEIDDLASDMLFLVVRLSGKKMAAELFRLNHGVEVQA